MTERTISSSPQQVVSKGRFGLAGRLFGRHYHWAVPVALGAGAAPFLGPFWGLTIAVGSTVMIGSYCADNDKAKYRTAMTLGTVGLFSMMLYARVLDKKYETKQEMKESALSILLDSGEQEITTGREVPDWMDSFGDKKTITGYARRVAESGDQVLIQSGENDLLAFAKDGVGENGRPRYVRIQAKDFGKKF